MSIESVVLYHHIEDRIVYINSSVDVLLKLRTGEFKNKDIYSVKKWSPSIEFNYDVSKAYTCLLSHGFKLISSTLNDGCNVEIWSREHKSL
jgi:hypothetical protein